VGDPLRRCWIVAWKPQDDKNRPWQFAGNVLKSKSTLFLIANRTRHSYQAKDDVCTIGMFDTVCIKGEREGGAFINSKPATPVTRIVRRGRRYRKRERTEYNLILRGNLIIRARLVALARQIELIATERTRREPASWHRVHKGQRGKREKEKKENARKGITRETSDAPRNVYGRRNSLLVGQCINNSKRAVFWWNIYPQPYYRSWENGSVCNLNDTVSRIINTPGLTGWYLWREEKLKTRNTGSRW